jgi:hypothetical protein
MSETTDPSGSLEGFNHEQLVALLGAIQIEAGGGATGEEMGQLLRWAHRVHTEGLFLDLLLAGEIAVIGFEGEHGEQPRFVAMQHVPAAHVAASEGLSGDAG